MKVCKTCGAGGWPFPHGSGVCNTCRNENARKRQQATQHITAAVRKKQRATPLGKARDLHRGMCANSKLLGFPPPEFTIEEIVDICGGACCKTGISFSLVNNSRGKRNPFAPSPDRIDPAIGYTKDNVQWVCWMFNLMKCDYEPAVVDFFISALKD